MASTLRGKQLSHSQDEALQMVLARVDTQEHESRQRLLDLLRIPSVSADPSRLDDCRHAAEFVCNALKALGFDIGLRESGGQPFVVGSHPGPRNGVKQPRVLIYGHYDVQPPDPVALWTSPPFEPRIAEGPNGPQVFARGASDNKGQLVSWIEALRAYVEEFGEPPLPVCVLVEGEEEVGSPNLGTFLADHAGELAADIAIANDASMWDVGTPALVTTLRGMVYAQIDLTAASCDLHSGLYGGLAVNPLTVLVRILADLHQADGKVTLPGFYEGVAEPPAAERQRLEALGFDVEGYLGDVGLRHPTGEAEYGPLERIWLRPTAEINGIWGGYTGEGSKTVIPAQAHAKVSFRLVPGQNPATIASALETFVRDRLPEDVGVSITIHSASPATTIDAQSQFVDAARRAMGDEFGREPVLAGSGGTLPVIEGIRKALDIPALLYGWAQNDDNAHSPDEKFELTCLQRGARCHARVLDGLARMTI